MGAATLSVDVARLGAEIDELATFSDAVAPAVTRVLYTARDMEARAFVKRLAMEAGLTIREDAIGNLYLRWEGTDPSLPAVGTGSHCDAIPDSGKYDGTVGVLGGIEAVRALQASGVKPKHSIEVIMFTSEEPTRFGVGCIGSRAMCGAYSPEKLLSFRDREGVSFDEARLGAGFTGDLSTVKLGAKAYSAFVELHIEQAPLLERDGIPIGVVTAIAAPASLRIKLTGTGGHAGTVLMPERCDALLAAAEIALAVEAAAYSTGSPDTVATTGVLKPFPGAINSIPSAVTMEIDVRDIASAPRDAAVHAITQATTNICIRRDVGFAIETLNADPPATHAPEIISAVEKACRALGLASRRMPSRAYHDSLFMARIAPTGMIFIPCRDGVSHRPDEYAAPEDIGRGVEVLAHTLATLAQCR